MKKTLLRSLAAFAATTLIAGAAYAATYKVIARNDLGMHCACPTFDGFLLLPPYNTLRAQVIMVDPSMMDGSAGLTVSYSMAEETDASLQADPYYSSWITNAPRLFPGFQPVVGGKVKGITGNGISGTMTYDSVTRSFNATGIPAYPVTTGNPAKDIMTDPFGGPNRDPYLTANITVKDSSGATVATTSTVVPVAFGGCCTCHLPLAQQNGYPATAAGSFKYLGKLHGQNSSKIDLSYLDPTGRGVGGPVRCSWCHWDPAMGESAAPGLAKVWPNYVILPGAGFTRTDVKISSRSFSDVLHKYHAQNTKVLTQFDPNIANNCYACHPGNGASCYRGAHKGKTAIWCIDCHGNLTQRIATNQMAQPWQQSTLPTCFGPSPGITSAFACHPRDNNVTNGWPGVFGKFINSRGHEGSVLCDSCHGSPHGEMPSLLAADNVQNQTQQNAVAGATYPAGKDSSYPIGVCNVCHTDESTTWHRPPHTND